MEIDCRAMLNSQAVESLQSNPSPRIPQDPPASDIPVLQRCGSRCSAATESHKLERDTQRVAFTLIMMSQPRKPRDPPF